MANLRVHSQVNCQLLVKSSPSLMKTMHRLLLETNLGLPKAKGRKIGVDSKQGQWEPKPPKMIV